MSNVPTNSATTPVYLMALGTFAIGTESFMIAPLLPKIAADLSVSVSAAGQLVTAFTLALALSSPVLTTVTSNFNRRKLLILSMIIFTLGNVAAWASTDYAQIMGARILLALAAGLYSPNASALAGTLVPPEMRGRALSIINGGMTIAIALGLPLGAMIGDRLGWRATFLGVGVLAATATAGLIFGLHRGIGDHPPVTTLRERIEVVRRPAVLLALLVTAAWAAGAYTVWTYIAPYLTATVGLDGPKISGVAFLWGIAAAIGIFVGGRLNDKFGSRSVILVALFFLALAFTTLSLSALLLPQTQAVVPVLGAVVVWGLTAWGFFPPQQARLICIGGHKVAPVVLSLNATFMYAGFSVGAALGSVVLAHGSVIDLGWVGASFEIVALLVAFGTSRSRVARPIVVQP
ncbi:MFS transporter [Bradyrhizobium erythrophlei]|uniref:Predicted arabinose efflux permease, MFS family n=1 Tax=Bradyrhizobium erythrophlei TaxID=1437360 RepID=A0A1H4WTL9_9BRAD|nr:MFS transporter [Bradyrhizobium erythrophlei]SEC96649.1 Predicted arabinose efflux permease, MFS family [Bradyrhizobium erythrophlei]